MKLVAIDMDGTLLNSQNEVSDETVDYLIQLIDKRLIKVVIVTGRPIHGVTTKLPDRLMQKVSIIGLNGCIVIDEKGSVVENHVLTEEEVHEIIQYGDELKADVVIMDSYNYYTVSERVSEIMSFDSALNNLEVILMDRSKLETIPHWNKMLFYFEDFKKITDLKKKLPVYYHQNYGIEFSQPFLVEFLPKGINKGTILKNYAEREEISMDDVFAIGDGLNDQTMLDVAGKSIAMQNSVPEILEIANHVTLTNDEEGVKYAIKEFILSNN